MRSANVKTSAIQIVLTNLYFHFNDPMLDIVNSAVLNPAPCSFIG